MVDPARIFASAVRSHQAGRFAEAEEFYRAILNDTPQHPHALHLLGVLAHQTGRPQEALDLILRALAVQGPHPVFHSNLSAVCLDLGRLDEAIHHAREAVRLKHDLPDAHNNLGVALRRQGHLDEAATAFRAAIALNPNHADARSSLGAVLHRQGLHADALHMLRETVRIAPAHAQARNDLGGVLIACNEPAEAERHLREAILLRPTFAEAHANLGLALRDLNRMDEAMDCFREALRINPGYVPGHNYLGYALEVQGRIDEGAAEYRESLRLDPDNVMAIANLSALAVAGRHRFHEEEILRIRQLAARADLAPDDRSRLNFALGTLFDEAGDAAAAFDHYRLGNELRKDFERRRGVAYDPAAHHQFVDRLIAFFDADYFERVRPVGVDSELPVFIVGMPRSGTTLAEQILASHPRVHGAGELRDVERLAGALAGSASAAYPQSLATAEAAALRGMAEGHLRRLRQLGGVAERVLDKAPLNFLHLGLVATLFPRARVIDCRRNPVDTCLSCFFQNFGSPPPFTLDLRHLGHFFREYERLMAHWAAVLPLPLFELSYEELTADQETVSRRLVNFCGLDWDEHCLRFHETRRVVRTASLLQVRQRLYRSAVGRAKRYETYLGPLREELNS